MTKGRPWILGLSTGFHNGAACLCHGDEIVVAIQEERLTRLKRAPIADVWSSRAAAYCLAAAGLRWRDLDLIADCTIAKAAAAGQAEPPEEAAGIERIRVPHHLGHALSVFCTSGLQEADVLIVDGGGSFGWELPDAERAAAVAFDEQWCEHVSLYHADRHAIEAVEKHLSDLSYVDVARPRAGMIPFRSLGHMFSSVAAQIFGAYLEAGKVMALAAYGVPRLDADAFGTFDGRAFSFRDTVPAMFRTDERWPARRQEYCDLAASVQHALETILASLLARVRTGSRQHLCYAGGVALNTVANHRVVRHAGFEDVHIIPAAEDNGTAIGAAYYGLMTLRRHVPSRPLRVDSLGRSYTAEEVNAAIAAMPAVEVVAAVDVAERCVDLLCEGRIVAWFQGGAEFGPRALGHRSILCDPRLCHGKDLLNRRVKYREAFRPFAPAVLAERTSEWFDVAGPNGLTAFMLEIAAFRADRPGPAVPVVEHVDGSGRLQTVHRATNPAFYALIDAFYRRTGVPMLVNTSLNVMGEPIVETPRDALWLLLFTGLDYCVIEDRIVCRSKAFTSALDLMPARRDDSETRFTEAITSSYSGREPLSGPRQLLRRLFDRVDGQRSFRAICDELFSDLSEQQHLQLVGTLCRREIVEVSR